MTLEQKIAELEARIEKLERAQALEESRKFVIRLVEVSSPGEDMTYAVALVNRDNGDHLLIRPVSGAWMRSKHKIDFSEVEEVLDCIGD